MKVEQSTVEKVRGHVFALYAERSHDVPFHGRHHVEFVASKSRHFAGELGADESIVELSALVHDLNYLSGDRVEASAGADLRRDILRSAGLDENLIETIESVVLEAETSSRGADISAEAKALSDADTLFKALPITPVVLAPLYMVETGASLRDLATKIVEEQVPLNDQELSFYTSEARRRYSAWIDANLRLWVCILEALDDPDVSDLMTRLPYLASVEPPG